MLRLRRKRKGKGVDEKQLNDIIKQELAIYVKRDELQEYLENIERDKKRKKLWDSLPDRKKLKVLRYALGERRRQHGEK